MAEIGRGAVGVVYHVRRGEEERALKTAYVDVAQFDEDLRRRVIREGTIARDLPSHPAIVRVYESGVIAPYDHPYLVMDLVDGQPLLDFAMELPGAPYPGGAPTRGYLAAVLALIRQVSEGLEVLHHAGIVHRDLKPANMLVQAQQAKIVDLGFAVDFSRPGVIHTITGSRVLLGTALYMPPEVCAGARYATTRSDLYALAVILFRLVAGRHPFEDESTVAILRNHLQTPAPRVRDLVGESVPERLDHFLVRCLAKDPAARPESAGALTREIGGMIDELGLDGELDMDAAARETGPEAPRAAR